MQMDNLLFQTPVYFSNMLYVPQPLYRIPTSFIAIRDKPQQLNGKFLDQTKHTVNESPYFWLILYEILCKNQILCVSMLIVVKS